MLRTLLASLLLTTAAAGCTATAQADQVAAPSSSRIAIAVAAAKVRAPYDVQILRENGDQLPTHALKDRFYVQGNDGERYTIRITNPTPRRVEAVISVDGLDVIDGESGDLRKRGYVVPAYGETRIEGFRTSTSDVATFRFSSVDNSYAGQKGKARNVGVIAVAIFEEQAAQEIIAPEPQTRHPYDYEEDLEVSSSRGRGDGGATKSRAPRVGAADKKAPAEAQRRPAQIRPPSPAPTGTGGAGWAPSRPAPRPDMDDEGGDYYQPPTPPTVTRRTERPGLGTEFGEQRYSAASFTRFVRAANRPIAIAELRYNDAAGLVALGIPLQPLPDAGEIMTRETADPFPGDDRFARPPGR